MTDSTQQLQPHPVGRLVVLLDSTPHEPSIKAFAHAARRWIDPNLPPTQMPTLLASGNVVAHKVFAARWPRLFYNVEDPAPFGQLLGFLPWAEVWLVQEGQVWALTEGRLLACVSPSLRNLDDDPLPADLAGLDAENHHRNLP